MDTALPAALAADLEDAFPRLVEECGGLVFTVLVRACGRDDAEDLAQETFIRAYRALSGYPPERRRTLALRPWLVTIAVNAARNALRTRRRHPSEAVGRDLEGLAGASAEPEPEAHALGAADREELALRLAGLPSAYRLAVVLRHVEGLSYAEIAEVVGAPVGTVKAQVSRGIAQLRAGYETEVPA